MFDLSQVLVLSLAASQVVEVWRHGEICQEWRAWLETRPYGDFVSDVMSCPFCLSVWVGWTVTAVFGFGYAAYDSWIWPVAGLAKLLIVGLAVSRASNLLNDLFYSYNRTPKDQA